jgi:hypothetical protein
LHFDDYLPIEDGLAFKQEFVPSLNESCLSNENQTLKWTLLIRTFSPGEVILQTLGKKDLV